MKTLIIFASKYGCTKECAQFLQQKLHAPSDLCHLPLDPMPSLDDYETIIVGGSIYAGAIQKQITAFCSQYEALLRTKTLGFFVCCASSTDVGFTYINNSFPAPLVAHAHATGVFGGDFRFQQMNWLERQMIRLISKTQKRTAAPSIDLRNIEAFATKMEMERNDKKRMLTEDKVMKEIEFNDAFEDDSNLCYACGDDAVLIGYNELLDLSKFECENCHAIYIEDDHYNVTYLQGGPRDWLDYLSKNLTLPFDGVIDESQGDMFSGKVGPLEYGDRIVVEQIIEEDDLYGILVDIRKGGKQYSFPLCDIAAENKKSENYKILDGYRTWFSNCR